MATEKQAIDYETITGHQQTMWASGNFHEIARQVVSVSERLCQAVDPHAGQRVLDVACGSGNAALVAARRYCDVTGIDYVPALIERAKVRANAEGTKIDFRVGDAQALPFPDRSFDVILSVFGVMFAPNQEKAASELLRVCRPGGRIGLCCWTPTGFGGDYFAAQSRYVPPPSGIQPPVRWGTEEGIRELLGAGTSSLEMEPQTTLQYFHSPAHAVEVLSTYFGPTHRAFQVVETSKKDSLRKDLEGVFAKWNRAKDGTLVVESNYLRTIAVKK
jgi:ubiquinone/menaquinone biosynthesis C-methylase UbiE